MTDTPAHCDADEYLVWSNEHRAWWGPDSKGYAMQIENAGVYSRSEATDIATATPWKWTGWSIPPEIAVRIADIPAEARAKIGAKK